MQVKTTDTNNDNAGVPGTSAEEQGSVNSGSPASSTNEDNSEQTSLFEGIDNIPEEVMDDPDLIDMMKEERKEKGEKEETPKPSDSDSESNEEKEGEEAEGKEGDEGEEVKGEKDQDGEDANGEESEYEYSDTEIAGEEFKADELKTIPVESLEKFAKIKNAVEDVNNKYSQEKEKNETLLSDPVIKARVEDLQSGKEKAISPELDTSEYNYIEQAIDEGDSEKAKQLLQSAVDNRVKHYVSEKLVQAKEQQELENAKNKAAETLLEIGNLNEDLKLDVSAKDLMSINKNSEGYEKYQSGLGKLLGKLGDLQNEGVISNIPQYINKMGSKGLYAAFAEEFGWPVAMNTGERDRNIAKSEREKLLSSFRKPVSNSKTKRTNTSTKGEATLENEGGLDKDRVDDPEYIEELLNSANSDEDIFEVQEMIKKRSI